MRGKAQVHYVVTHYVDGDRMTSWYATKREAMAFAAQVESEYDENIRRVGVVGSLDMRALVLHLNRKGLRSP